MKNPIGPPPPQPRLEAGAKVGLVNWIDFKNWAMMNSTLWNQTMHVADQENLSEVSLLRLACMRLMITNYCLQADLLRNAAE